MTDEEFLTYCYWHSRTERHLFTVGDARRLCRLAGVDMPEDVRVVSDAVLVGMDFDFVGWKVDRAREWLAFREKNPNVREAVESFCPSWHR